MALSRFVAVAVAAVLLSACGSGGRSIGPPDASVGQQADAALPAALRSMTLVSSTDQPVDLASFTGKVVVISDMMTLCQETCPLDTANVVAAAEAVERAGLGNKVEFLSITVDPTRDTPTRLAAYRKLYAPAPANWLVLTGSPTDIAQLWKTLGVYTDKVADTPPAPLDWLTGKPLSYDITHSDEVFFLGTDGTERFLLEGAPHVAPGAPIPAKLKSFMDATGHDNLDHPDPNAWTLPQELDVISWLTNHRITHSDGS